MDHDQGNPPPSSRDDLCSALLQQRSHQGKSIRFARRHRALFENVLDGYLWHGVIDVAAYRAGTKFAREFARAVLKTSLYETGAGLRGDFEMPVVSAVHSSIVLRKALAVLPAASQDILVRVCVDNYRAESTRGVRALRKALDMLVKHWGVSHQDKKR